jgi:hypothetical protein
VANERVAVVRADDLLVCELELDGLAVAGTSPHRQLVEAAGGGKACLIVHFPPQHVAEEAIPAFLLRRLGAVAGATLPAIPSRAAGPSRVAFIVPENTLPVPYELEAILALLTRCALAVNENAREPPDLADPAQWWLALLSFLNPPLLAEPGHSETAIELPFRLVLSPNERAGFSHAAQPVSHGAAGLTELWHSRLALAPDREGTEDDAPARPLRAVWLRQGGGGPWSPTDPGVPVSEDEEPFPWNTMNQHDRARIVHLSANRAFRKQTGADFDPSPLATRRLALSGLGAWLTSRGQWDSPAFMGLIEWSHRATQGRDQFVRIVDRGFLYPFCHLAALMKVSAREFLPDVTGDPALLVQRFYVLVKQPTREYPPGAAPARLWHTMPLRRVEIRTLVTPSLEVEPAEHTFLIRAEGADTPFPFKLSGVDAAGNAVELETPLVWISSEFGWDAATLQAAQQLYDTAPGHQLDTHGANVALAPSEKGDTTFPTTKLTFTAKPQPLPAPPLPPADKQPGFWPELVSAEVRAPALQIVTGNNDARTLSYHDIYRDQQFGGDNRSEVFAQLTGKLPLDFANKGDRSGALLQPNLGVEGLSRQLGAVGGPAAKLGDVGRGIFKPEAFFADDAKLFGVFTLKQVLAAITGAQVGDMPRLVTEGSGNTLAARYVWNPVPQNFPTEHPVFAVKEGVTQMELTANVPAKAADASSEIRAWIKNFELHLLGEKRFIEIVFDQIEFSALAGKKPDVDVQLGQVRFVGPLSFVERLKQIIPLNGFSDPPALTVDADGIRSGFSLAVPDVAVGVFALQNVTLGAGFTIPFRAGPLAVMFDFCKREEPFLLTVSLFGGGGFFALAIDPNGVQRLEAALEFGAAAAINLGVAQGGVHVMAGIYFKIETGQGATLSGYFRLGGNMSVLGLVSASIELYLSLTYVDPGKAAGKATLTIEIDIFLFSTSVEVTCERQFAGSANDPSFHELMQAYSDPQTGQVVRPWHQYCSAYA